jgi:hypothetical protein
MIHTEYLPGRLGVGGSNPLAPTNNTLKSIGFFISRRLGGGAEMRTYRRRYAGFGAKAALVAELKGARDRKRAATGKCGGRKSYQERDGEMVALAKKLARYPVNGRRRSLRDVAAELEEWPCRSQW